MIALALAAACSDPDDDRAALLARIGGPLGAQARALLRRPDRVAWLASVRAPVPPGLRGIDPTWIEAALAALPARARVALGQGARTPLDVWLARWATARFPTVPPADGRARPTTREDVVFLAAPQLRAWLEEVGADQLAYALGDKASALGARMAAVLARIAHPPRAGELGPRRAALARANLSLDATALIRIGARAIAPHLDAAMREVLVHRLPRPLGLVVRAEILGAPAGPGPTWRALAAP